jgi:hypothetical protein
LFFRNSGCFGIVKLGGAPTKKRQERHHENDDADSADPLCETSPEVERLWKSLQVDQRGASGGGKSAHTLKKGVSKRWNGSTQ